MIVKSSYDSVGDVPQEFKDSFSEVDGKYVFSGQIDVKTQADVDKVLGAKQHIDKELSEVKELLKAEKQAKTEVQNKLEVVELKLENGAETEGIQELVAKKVKAETAELTKQLEEANEKNSEFQNKIFSGEKAEFVNGIIGSFSDTVKDDAKFILNQMFERQADNTYLTKEGLGLEAGLNAEQATAKLLETRTHWQQQNTGGQGTGAQGAGATDDRAKFNELLKKQQSGETLNRQEAVELSTIANQLKNEE